MSINTEHIIAFGLIAGIALTPLIIGVPDPVPFADEVVAMLFAIGAIVLIETGSGTVSVGNAKLNV